MAVVVMTDSDGDKRDLGRLYVICSMSGLCHKVSGRLVVQPETFLLLPVVQPETFFTASVSVSRERPGLLALSAVGNIT